jgi:hypothetical protein
MLHGHEDAVKYHKEVIGPYKGAVEEWYVANQSVRIYLMVIIVTIWVVIFPDSNMVHYAFPGLPEMPSAISEFSDETVNT